MLCKVAVETQRKLQPVKFSIPQIEYPLGGSSIKCSHVYVLLIVDMILLL